MRIFHYADLRYLPTSRGSDFRISRRWKFCPWVVENTGTKTGRTKISRRRILKQSERTDKLKYVFYSVHRSEGDVAIFHTCSVCASWKKREAQVATNRVTMLERLAARGWAGWDGKFACNWMQLDECIKTSSFEEITALPNFFIFF